MKRYKMEVFDINFNFIEFKYIEQKDINIDYVTLEKSEFSFTGTSFIQRGNYVKVTGDGLNYEGIVCDHLFDSNLTKIYTKQLLSICDSTVFFDIEKLSEKSLELCIKDTLSEYYINTNDIYQRIPGLSIEVRSNTDASNLVIDSSVHNLYDIILLSLSKYDVILDCNIDIINKKFTIIIKKIDLVNINMLETKIADVIDFSVSLSTSNDSNFNKIVYINERDISQRLSLFASSNGYITEDSNDYRILPVVYTTKLINSDNFIEDCYLDAEREMLSSNYNHLIEIIFKTDSMILDIDEIGRIYKIVDKENIYVSILTGFKRLNDKQTLLIFGSLRQDLTQILSIERRRK